MTDERPVYITAFCVGCNEPRYRSTKALRVGQDKLDPSMFQPVKAGIPQPGAGQKAECHICGGPLKMLQEPADNVLPERPSPESPTPARDTKTAARMADAARQLYDQGAGNEFPAPPSPVTELFKVGPDEKVIEMIDTTNKILIITSQRVVAIQKD